MSKYNINKAFNSLQTFPVNRAIIKISGQVLKNAHQKLNSYQGIIVEHKEIPVKDGAIAVHIIKPENAGSSMPCIIDYHGGGFVFDAGDQHYSLAVHYAIETGSVVIFPRYTTLPKTTATAQLDECKAAYLWVKDNADALNIDITKLGILGDSAGGYLAARITNWAVENSYPVIYQVLVYPVTDPLMRTDSMARFSDTPVWNSKNNQVMWKYYLSDGTTPAEASLLDMAIPSGLPAAYVEPAQFDCLHDEGIAYANRLSQSSVAPPVIYETKETIHGFDCVDCPITSDALKHRTAFIKAQLE